MWPPYSLASICTVCFQKTIFEKTTLAYQFRGGQPDSAMIEGRAGELHAWRRARQLI